MLKLLGLAIRNLTRNRRRTLLSILAVVVGISTMVFVRGFMLGERRAIIFNITDGTLGALQIHRKGYMADLQALPLAKNMTHTPELRKKILSVPGVTGVSARIVFGAMLSTPEGEKEQGKAVFMMVTAIDTDQELKALPRRKELIGDGAFFKGSQGPDLILEADFAKSLKIPLVTGTRPPEEQWPALLTNDVDGSLNGENVLLTATLHTATPFDQQMGFVPLATAQRLLRMEGKVTELAVSVDRLDNVPRIKAQLEEILGPDLEVHAWDDLVPFMRDMIQIQGALFSILTTIFVVIVLLGIVNAMLMNVLERVREIGTMMAVGVRRRQILTLFVLEGGVLGGVGGLIGLLLGGLAIYFTHKNGITFKLPGATASSVVRPWVETGFLLQAFAMASLGSALAASWPAFRASRLRPVEALHAP